MITFQEASSVIHQTSAQLREKYGVRKIGIFGSVARDEQHENSDIDILVCLENPVGLLKFAGLMNALAESLGQRVDLADDADLRPELAEKIRKEVRFIDER